MVSQIFAVESAHHIQDSKSLVVDRLPEKCRVLEAMKSV
jgi:hypothetical protein